LTPVITAPAGIVTDKGIGQDELVAVVGAKLYNEFPLPAVYVALALPVLDVALVEAFIGTTSPEHKLKSEPAFTVGPAIPVPDADTF
jgi:hypothetical protein